MSYFMRKNSDDLFFVQIIDQSVVKGNALFWAKALKIGVGFSASFGAIDHKNIIQFKTNRSGVFFNFIT